MSVWPELIFDVINCQSKTCRSHRSQIIKQDNAIEIKIRKHASMCFGEHKPIQRFEDAVKSVFV